MISRAKLRDRDDANKSLTHFLKAVLKFHNAQLKLI